MQFSIRELLKSKLGQIPPSLLGRLLKALKPKPQPFISPLVSDEWIKTKTGEFNPARAPRQEMPTSTPTPTARPAIRSVLGAPLPREAEPTVTPTPTPTAMPQLQTPTPQSRGATRIARNPDVQKLPTEGYAAPFKAIELASREFGVPRDLLMDIAFAESSLDPKKKNPKGSDTGLFQFTDETWVDMKRWMGELLPENADRYDPVTNARAAAWAIANGYLGKWVYSKDKWGAFYEDEELEGFYR